MKSLYLHFWLTYTPILSLRWWLIFVSCKATVMCYQPHIIPRNRVRHVSGEDIPAALQPASFSLVIKEHAAQSTHLEWRR